MDLAVPAEQLGEKRKRDVNAAIFGYGDELQCNQKLRIAGNTSGPPLVISGRLAEDREEEMKQHCVGLWNIWKEFEKESDLSESQAAAREFVFAQITLSMQVLFLNSKQTSNKADEGIRFNYYRMNQKLRR